MKIIYNAQCNKEKVEAIATEQLNSVEVTFQVPFFKPVRKSPIREKLDIILYKLHFKKVRLKGIPPGIGFAPSEGWIHFGQYVISVIFNEPVFQGIVGSAIWDGIKKLYDVVKTTGRGVGERKERELAIITDNYGENNSLKTICFVLPDTLSDTEFELAVSQIPDVRKKLIDFLLVAGTTGTMDVIKFRFSTRWYIHIINQ